MKNDVELNTPTNITLAEWKDLTDDEVVDTLRSIKSLIKSADYTLLSVEIQVVDKEGDDE